MITRESRHKYFKDNPWAKHYKRASDRCNYKKGEYHKLNILFNMTTKDFKEIWFRDKAYLLSRPSIDRINPDGNYIKDNCRFIELKENCGARRKRGALQKLYGIVYQVNRLCSIEGCGRPHAARGCCKRHHKHLMKKQKALAKVEV